jgi:predicted metalloendopeptidase
MQNVLTLLQLNAKQNFRRLRKPVDRHEWIGCDLTTVNAFYHVLFNDISKISSSRTLHYLYISL